MRAPALPVPLLLVRSRRPAAHPVAQLRSRPRPRRVALPCRPARDRSSRAPCSASLHRPSEHKHRRQAPRTLRPPPQHRQVLVLRLQAPPSTDHRAALRVAASTRSAERWWPIRQASVSTPTVRAEVLTAPRPVHLRLPLPVSARPHRPQVASAARRLRPRVGTAARRPVGSDRHQAVRPAAASLHQAVEGSALRRPRRSELLVALRHRPTVNPKAGTPRRKRTALPRRAIRRAVRWSLRRARAAPPAKRATR